MNQIIHGDSVVELGKLESNSIDLCIFSPPYDQLRDYHGCDFDLHGIGKQLYRVLKHNSMCVMVINDQTVNGKKSLTTFRTIIDWCDSIGFGLWETPIYHRHGKEGAWWSKRLRVDHEYMPCFLKGEKPSYFNKEPIKIPCKHGGKTTRQGANRNKDNLTTESKKMTINPTKCPGTVWDLSNGGDKVHMKRMHPATFPDALPYRFIQLFTRENDVILDPMCGSGSTCIAAHALNRKYIGIDISEDYCSIARKRIDLKQSNLYDDFVNFKQRQRNAFVR